MSQEGNTQEHRWTFDWSRTRVLRVRTLFALAVALIIHGLLFYLFQVSYPRSSTEIPKRYGITVLTAGGPTSPSRSEDMRADVVRLLREIGDYHAGYSSTLRLDSPLNVPLEPLTYTPSFENFQLSLLPWPGEITPNVDENEETEPFPLPPVSDASEPDPPNLSDFQIVFQGALSERPLIEEIQWTLPVDSPLAVDGLAEFTISVTPEGNVAHVFLLHGRELSESEGVMERLRRLRFEPVPGAEGDLAEGDLTWGSVIFRW